MQADRMSSLRRASVTFAFASLVSASAVAKDQNHDVLVLSNRADLISGGDALVEIVVPPGIVQAMRNGNQKIKASLDSVPLSDGVFDVRPDGRVYGLVTGLKNGPNILAVKSPGKSMSIVITNHPVGGPIFSGGAQLQPWICATSASKSVTVVAPRDPSLTGVTATRVSGLTSDPIDAQCNTATEFRYYYQPKAKVGTGCTLTITGANPCFVSYDPAARPADADIADFTNDRGDTVKSMLRLEIGTINRSLYQVLSYFDPARPWAPWSPQKGWNGKVLWNMGFSTSSNRFEGPVAANATVFDPNALGAGFMSVNTTLTDHNQNNNELLAAETVMMVKEHIIEAYGEIRYTMADGQSGGSMMQTTIATVMPGLLDGIQPAASYPDAASTWIETMDCGLLRGNYFGTPNGSLLTEAQKAAINGHPDSNYCNTWVTSFLGQFLPTNTGNCGAGFPASIVYHPTLRPNGVRCDTQGSPQEPQWGTFVDADGNTKTKLPYDNVGVQYGLKALQAGAISAEEFVRLNEGVGSYDNDRNWSGSTPANPVVPAPRHAAQADVLPTVYLSGIIADGKQLAKVPIIDLRSFNLVADIHMPWRSMSERDRLDRANGGHANQVIRAFRGGAGGMPGAAGATQSFKMLDRWLANIEADVSPISIEDKVVKNRPADVNDACFNTNGSTVDQISTELPLDSPECVVGPGLKMTSPRIVAGGPLAENVFKCQLKVLSLSDSDYQGIAFTPNQAARLAAVFPSGVCDWTKAGVAQTNAVLTTFSDGPGGKPLPLEPIATH